MPSRAPFICGCGHKVPSGTLCACARKRKAEADKKRLSARGRGYDTRWDRERLAYLKVNKTCVLCHCEANTIDHITPHKGDKRLFWNRSNWQPMCSPCHSSRKQRLERNRPGGSEKSYNTPKGPEEGGFRGNFSISEVKNA